MNLLITLLININIALLLISVSFWLHQLNIYTEKANPYEYGFDPMGPAHLPFSMKFFLVAITFLLFDLEIALLLPLHWATQTKNLKLMLTMALILVLILTFGLVYELMQKGLEWN